MDRDIAFSLARRHIRWLTCGHPETGLENVIAVAPETGLENDIAVAEVSLKSCFDALEFNFICSMRRKVNFSHPHHHLHLLSSKSRPIIGWWSFWVLKTLIQFQHLSKPQLRDVRKISQLKPDTPYDTVKYHMLECSSNIVKHGHSE